MDHFSNNAEKQIDLQLATSSFSLNVLRAQAFKIIYLTIVLIMIKLIDQSLPCDCYNQQFRKNANSFAEALRR